MFTRIVFISINIKVKHSAFGDTKAIFYICVCVTVNIKSKFDTNMEVNTNTNVACEHVLRSIYTE